MSEVAHPTVIVGLDAHGRRVTARLRRLVAHPQVRALDATPTELGPAFAAALDELLRAGAFAQDLRERRLDVVLVAEVLDGADDALAVAARACADVVGTRFTAVFPPDRPPEQRGAALHALLLLPPMGPSPAAARACSRLERLRRAGGAYPLFARAWLHATQTTAGTIATEDVEASAAAFAVALWFSGHRRTDDHVAARLSHLPDGDPAFAFLSAASLDLPTERLLAYATARAAHDGLRTLVRRVERPADRSAGDSVAMTALDVDGLVAPFVEGDVAQGVRKSAARLSGPDAERRAEIQVGAWDGPPVIRARYGALFEPATVVKEPTREERTVLADVLAALDRAEAGAASEVRASIRRLYDDALGKATGLRRLPEVELGLRHVIATLEDQDRDDVRRSSTPDERDPDPLRAELEAAVAALPGWGATLATSGAMALAVGLLVFAVVAVFAGPPPAAAGGPSGVVVSGGAPTAGVDWLRWAPWGAGLVVMPVAALVWSYVVGRVTRNKVGRALTRRRDAVAALQAQGGGGAPAQQAEAQLLLRRRRVRRATIRALEHALLELAAVRSTLLAGRDAMRQRLVDLGVDPSEEAATDDLSRLLGKGDLLHDRLAPAPVVARFVARSRATDPELWADRLLDATWPAGGLGADVPCADPEDVAALAREQADPLTRRSLFESPDAAQAAADVVRGFVARCAAALAPPVEPRDAKGDVPRGTRPGETLAFAPIAGRDALTAVLRDAPYPLTSLWSASVAPRFVLVRTWEGLTLEDVARGAGLLKSIGGDA